MARNVKVCHACGTRMYECEVCGKLYVRVRSDQKTCGNACRVRKSRKKKATG